MKRKLLALALCLCTGLILLPATASADMGPKPSVTVDFQGLEGEVYYVTLLSKTDSTGPHSALSRTSNSPRYQESDPDYDIYRRFLDYRDADGLYFLQFFGDCTETQQFYWGYYPPTEFKILIYFPAYNHFTVSIETFGRYAFDSFYSADFTRPEGTPLTAMSHFSAKQGAGFRLDLPALGVRILLTLAVELGLALLFGLRGRRQLLLIGLVNLFTQLLLNGALQVVSFQSGALAVLLLFPALELVVFVVEAVVYALSLRHLDEGKVSSGRAVLYAFVANLASLALGLGLAALIPGWF